MCTIVCLLGVSYAGYTSSLRITQDVRTARMDYIFSSDDKTLNITFGQSVANYFLNMKPGENYTISYQLDSQSIRNVPLKSIDHKYVGSIDINLVSVLTNLPQGLSNENLNYLTSLLPGSLGEFECYNDFDNNMGMITLVKKTEPEAINCNKNKSELPPALLLELGIAETDESSLKSEKESANENSDLDIGDQDKILDEQQITESAPNIVMTIGVEGTYGFNIPLHFEQFNSK